MTVLGAPVWYTPGATAAAEALRERPGHPVVLIWAEPVSVEDRAAVAALDVPAGAEFSVDLPAGFGLWPLEAAAAGLARAFGSSPQENEGVEFLLDTGLQQASWLLALCSKLDVPVQGCRVTWSAFAGQPCRKFHRDSLLFRLVTTFRGPGTEWGLDEQLVGRDETVTGVPIFTAGLYEPLLLPGKLAPLGIAPGVIHRSPPQDGGAVRLVLRVDALPLVSRTAQGCPVTF
jgi:hypothetical protein